MTSVRIVCLNPVPCHDMHKLMSVCSIYVQEARLAIEQFVIPYGQAVELLPRTSEVMALQIKLVEGYQLQTEQAGTNGASRLRIIPSHVLYTKDFPDEKHIKKSTSGPDMNIQSGTSVSRLPVLPA